MIFSAPRGCSSKKTGSFVKQFSGYYTFKGTKTLNQKEKYMQQQSKQQLKI